LRETDKTFKSSSCR